MKAILSPTTASASSSSFSPASDSITMQVAGLQNNETATIEFYNPDTNSYVAYAGVPQFSSTVNLQDVYLSYATYRITKTATANAIGVYIAGGYVPLI